jgi:hypothetical protein
LGVEGASATPVAWTQPACAAAEEAKAPPLPTLGSRLVVPDISLIDGSPWRQQSGRPLLVYWWASTCPFCALQSPSMDKLWAQVRTQGWQMIALSVDRRSEDAAAYIRTKRYGFPVAWTSPGWRGAFPKPRGLPITLLAGADGLLKVAEKGQLFDEDVMALPDALL